MRGRKPKPTEIKRTEGNPGKRKLNNKEPRVNKDMPECPIELTEKARGIWEQIAGELHKAGVLTSIDGGVLAMYCQGYATYLMLLSDVEREGMMVSTCNQNGDVTGTKINPKQVEARLLAGQLKALASEYGLTPSARSRIQVDKPKDKSEKDKIQDFFRKKAVNG